jgi:hypothetical protein
MMIANNNENIAVSIRGEKKIGRIGSKDVKSSAVTLDATEKVLESITNGSTFFTENPPRILPVFKQEGKETIASFCGTKRCLTYIQNCRRETLLAMANMGK